MDSIGGVKEYIQLYKTNNPIPIKQTIVKNFVNASSYGLYLLIPFLFLFIYGIRKLKYNNITFKKLITNEIKLLHLALYWTVPSIIFFNLVHYAKGYYYICVVGIIILLLIFYKNELLNNKLIIIISIVQIIAFIFLPYKQPMPDIILNPQSRKVSKLHTWLCRMQSPYSLGQNQLRELGKYYLQIQNGLNYLKEKNKLSKAEFFIDPSSPITGRILSVYYFDNYFSYMNRGNINSYMIFKGVWNDECTDFEEMISRSIIIGSPEFAKKYIKDDIEIILDYENITFFKAKKDKLRDLKNKYDYYFLK